MKITLPLKNFKGELIEERTIEFTSLRCGQIKRLFRLIDVDRMQKTCKTKEDLVQYVLGLTAGMGGYTEQIVRELFDLTEEEFDNLVSVDDLAVAIAVIVGQSLRSLESTEQGVILKNLLRTEE